jgi:hypothetical protein
MNEVSPVSTILTLPWDEALCSRDDARLPVTANGERPKHVR